MKIVNWFNGKKTNIGSMLLIASVLISEIVVGIWHVEGGWVDPTIETLNWVGMGLGGMGLGHKWMKSKQTTST